MKMLVTKFMKTELGKSMVACIEEWDAAFIEMNSYRCYSEMYQEKWKKARLCGAQWEVYQKVLKYFFGKEYYFTRTDEYFGICTEDEDFLYKKNRKTN